MQIVRNVLLAAVAALTAAPLAAEEPWYRSPTLSIMTGFIKEPLKPYTIQEWEKGLGNQLDADRWVADFKEAGATYLIFYDKWIDGFVFHDTKTTGFKTRRDFVREIADACQRGNLRLIFYYNAVSDGNPEFSEWAVHDRRGNPIVFSPNWPTGYQTLHSPFRKISVDQARELLTGYGRIDGLWLDIFGERLNTSSPWTARAYETMYGAPFAQAPGVNLAEFNARTLAGYLDELRSIADAHQPGCVLTSNGSAANMLASGVWAKRVGSRLDYGSNEGHSFHRNDQLARMAWVIPKPTEIGLLLCSSWFSPREDAAPPASMTPRQAIAATAVAVCQGASVYMALTPGHSGVFGEDLQRAKAVGAWFKTVEPLVRDARPYADVGIVLGAPAPDGPGFPARNSLWKRFPARQAGTIDQAVALSDALGRAGVFSRLLYASEQGGSWPDSLSGFRAILVPEGAPLDDAHTEQLRQYVDEGGRLIAFGHASMLDAHGRRRDDYALADLFGARYRGETRFAPPVLGTEVKVDSEYSPEFAAEHLVDGLPTAWASGGTPMPHWAEIALAEPVDVAKVELVSRQGPYLVTDVDVEVHDGNAWKPVKSVRNASGRVISAAFDRPLRTGRIRVKILRETYQNEDRQYADVEAIRVFDTAGRDRALNRHAVIPLIPTAADLKNAFAAEPVVFPPMAVAVETSTAEVIAELDDGNRTPAMLRNRCGQGEAILVTTGEAALCDVPAFWPALANLAVGRPTLSCPGEDLDRYRVILTRVGDAHVLHVIDRAAAAPGSQAAEVTLLLDTERLGGPRNATPAGENAVFEARQEAGQMILRLRPDPVATVVLE